MLADALRRIGKISGLLDVAVEGGAADGYRTRARLHLRQGRVGFFEEGSHRLCEVAPSRQLSAASAETVARLAAAIAGAAPEADAEIEWAEDVPATTRVAHLTVATLDAGAALSALAPLDGVDGASWSIAGGAARQLWGVDRVVDRLRARNGETVAIAHGPRAFFQSNRHLLQAFVDDVVGRLEGPVLDLYSGVGLFALMATAADHPVIAVEGDDASAADLAVNAASRPGITVHHHAVERHLAGRRDEVTTVLVDPPRTGLSSLAVEGLVAWAPARLVYVSCDPATLARDLRRLLDAGYRLDAVRGFDLFPRTGHVEAVVTLNR
jgi:tRNA/tmRNA/rRNA uracil-C5-methylase (TrmA/RlmC/RlmD family)